MVHLVVHFHLRNTGRPSTYLTGRATRNRRGYRNIHIQATAILCTLGVHTHIALCMGHHHYPWLFRIRLLYRREPVADVHETDSSFQH